MEKNIRVDKRRIIKGIHNKPRSVIVFSEIISIIYVYLGNKKG